MAQDIHEFSDVEPVDALLREMFLAFCAQPLPNRLLSVADQLEEPEAMAGRSSRGG